MRAAIQPHLTVSPVAERVAQLRSTLLRSALALFVTIVLLIVWRPTIVRAQKAPMKAAVSAPASADTGSSTHVVRAGESLWSVAERFYGDGHKWQELATRNSISLSQDKPLLVGMKLIVPARHGPVVKAVAPTADPSVPKVALAPAPPPSSAQAVAPGTGSLAAQTTGKADAVAPPHAVNRARPAAATTARAVARKGAPLPKISRSDAMMATTAAATDTSRMEPPSRGSLGIGSSDSSMTPVIAHMGLVSQADMRAARDNADVATVFLRHVADPAEAEAQERAAAQKKAPAPRRGEYEAAPFVVREGRLAQSGHILRRIGAANVGSLGGVTRVLIADEVEISAPIGAHLAVGDRLVSVNADRMLGKDARVAVPSGTMIVRHADAGKPIIAFVRSQSGVIEEGQLLFAVEGAAPTVAPRAEPTATSDVETKVVWIDDVALIPTLQSYILLSAGSAQGVRAGDQFALVQRVGTGAAARDERSAVVRVVRSGPDGSSAIIVRQESSDIAVGGAARRVARVP